MEAKSLECRGGNVRIRAEWRPYWAAGFFWASVDDDDGVDGMGEDRPWYADGLAFECLWPRCTACCTGEPGYVWVTQAEIQRLAAHLEKTPVEFLREFAVRVDGRYSLIELANGDCVFLGEHGCKVYQDRPLQCVSYPFWPELLRDKATWDAEAQFCPGVNHGPIVPVETIEAMLEKKPARRPKWFDAQTPADATPSRAEVLASIRAELLAAAGLTPTPDTEPDTADTGRPTADADDDAGDTEIGVDEMAALTGPMGGRRRLVLASTSPRRRDLLGRLGVRFVAIDPGVVEPDPQAGALGADYAEQMARLKADAAVTMILSDPTTGNEAPPAEAMAEWEEEWDVVDVLAADTVVVAADGTLLGKPVDAADAERILRVLSGTTHTVITGFCLTSVMRQTGDSAAEYGADSAQIVFRELQDDEILAYVASGESFGKAGAYAVQETGDRFVARIDGAFTTVVGLPVKVVADLLQSRGYHVNRDALERADRFVASS